MTSMTARVLGKSREREGGERSGHPEDSKLVSLGVEGITILHDQRFQRAVGVSGSQFVGFPIRLP